MAAFTEKLENCEVCAINQAKYTCPKCEVRTCSLTCVNIHKKELDCDGNRDKVKFVPLHEFTDLDLLSDYRLLEEVGRSVDKLQRNPLKKCSQQFDLPTHLQKLRAAACRSGVRFEFLPQHFTRHKENTTYFKWKTNELFWRIEWIFPQAENARWVSKRAPECIRLSDLVQSVLDPVNSTRDESEENDDENTRALLQERLQFYRAAELTGIKVLLKAERIKKSDSRFYEMDFTMTLKENFAKKTIIEFPTLHVVLKDHTDMYEIVDSDDEEIVENLATKHGNRRRHRGKRTFNGNLKEVKKEPVNYFFDEGFSDSEDEKMEDISSVSSSKEFSSSHMNLPEYNELVRMEY